jgi:hypothetical protein
MSTGAAAQAGCGAHDLLELRERGDGGDGHGDGCVRVVKGAGCGGRIGLSVRASRDYEAGR